MILLIFSWIWNSPSNVQLLFVETSMDNFMTLQNYFELEGRYATQYFGFWQCITLYYMTLLWYFWNFIHTHVDRFWNHLNLCILCSYMIWTWQALNLVCIFHFLRCSHWFPTAAYRCYWKIKWFPMFIYFSTYK